MAHHFTEHLDTFNDYLEALFFQFTKLPRQMQYHVGRGLACLAISFFCVTAFAVNYAMASQETVPALTMKDNQQDYQIDGLKTQMTDMKSSRDERRREMDDWRKQTALLVDDSRERLRYDEGLAIGAFTLLSFLQGFGLFKSLQAQKLTERGNVAI